MTAKDFNQFNERQIAWQVWRNEQLGMFPFHDEEESGLNEADYLAWFEERKQAINQLDERLRQARVDLRMKVFADTLAEAEEMMADD